MPIFYICFIHIWRTPLFLPGRSRANSSLSDGNQSTTQKHFYNQSSTSTSCSSKPESAKSQDDLELAEVSIKQTDGQVTEGCGQPASDRPSSETIQGAGCSTTPRQTDTSPSHLKLPPLNNPDEQKIKEDENPEISAYTHTPFPIFFQKFTKKINEDNDEYI